MKTMHKTAGAIIALALSAGAASAAQIVQVKPFGPNTPNFSQNLTFNKFDAALGTLLSVKVQIDLSSEGGFLRLDNDGDQPAAGNAQLGSNVKISSMQVALVNNALQPSVGSGVTVATTAPFAIAGTDGDNTTTFDIGGTDYFELLGAAGSDMGMDTVSSLFHSQYIDAIPDMVLATYVIAVNATQIFNYGAIGGIAFSGGPVTASGNVTVTYNYTPVPAPGAAGLAGLGGLLLVRRNRKSK